MTGIGPVAVSQPRARERGRRYRPRPHPVLAVDPAALNAPVEVDRDAAADPLPEGISTGDFSEALAALLGKDAAGCRHPPSAA